MWCPDCCLAMKCAAHSDGAKIPEYFFKREKKRDKEVTLIITREMGTLSDAAAREEVILPQPVCEIFFPHLFTTLRDKRGGKF